MKGFVGFSVPGMRGIIPSLGGLVLVCLVFGCGPKSPATEGENTTPAPAAPVPAAPSNQGAAPSVPRQDNPQGGGANRKYVDGIPYDVFFDQPLMVAAENQGGPPQSPTTPGVAMSTPPAQTSVAESTSQPKPASSGGGSNWGDVVSKELLQDEVNRIRNSLSNNLNSVGNYNRELLTIQADASVLAALAGVVTQYDENFTWKDKAKYVRDMSAVIASAAESRGRPAFESAEKPFLNIVEILNGGSPADLPDSDDVTVFSDVAERNLLMKQVKVNADWLTTTISSEAEMKSKKDEIISRSVVLAIIGKVIKQEDYVFADEAEYQEYCVELLEAGLKMANGAREDNFDDFRTGLDLMNKSCNDCHPKYLNN